MGSQWALKPSVRCLATRRWGRGGGGGRFDYDEPETADAVITTKQLEHTHQKKRKKKNHLLRQVIAVAALFSPRCLPNAGTCACSVWRDVF